MINTRNTTSNEKYFIFILTILVICAIINMKG